MAPYSTQVQVGDLWNDSNRQRLYSWAKQPSTLNKAIGVFIYETPLPFGPLLSPLMDPFKASDAKMIANRCKASYKEYWDQVGCISAGVHQFFKNFKFDGLRSFCRSHAQAFNVVFDELNIKRTLSQHVSASGSSGEEHVANIVIITNDSGATFSYVIDSGWFPGTLFPQNDLAKRFHARSGTEHTDFFELPAISPNPTYRYTAAPR